MAAGPRERSFSWNGPMRYFCVLFCLVPSILR
jgi:hypothetical protein